MEHDDVIQALSTNGADHALDRGALPGRARGRQHWLDTHGLDLVYKFLAEDPVAIP
jgi:hypothetical protein